MALSHYHYRQQREAQHIGDHGQRQFDQQQQTVAVETLRGGEQEKVPVAPAPSSSSLSFAPPYSTPVFDETLLQDVFAEEERERRGAGESWNEGEGEKKAWVEEDVNPPPQVSHTDLASYPSTVMPQQHQCQEDQHQQSQPQSYHQQSYFQTPLPASTCFLPDRAGATSHAVGRGPGEGGRKKGAEGEESEACEPRLPILPPSLSRPTPVFDASLLQDVFGGEEGESVFEVGVQRAAIKREGEEEGREEESGEGQEGTFFGDSEKEVLDLFEDGSIESW